jgi:hypothetical protein
MGKIDNAHAALAYLLLNSVMVISDNYTSL